MKATGRKVSLALPVRTNWSITSGIEVSEASLQIGHEVSPYSVISTGAFASPSVLPDCVMPARSLLTLSTFVMVETASSSPPAMLIPTRIPTTTTTATIAPTM